MGLKLSCDVVSTEFLKGSFRRMSLSLYPMNGGYNDRIMTNAGIP